MIDVFDGAATVVIGLIHTVVRGLIRSELEVSCVTALVVRVVRVRVVVVDVVDSVVWRLLHMYAIPSLQ